MAWLDVKEMGCRGVRVWWLSEGGSSTPLPCRHTRSRPCRGRVARARVLCTSRAYNRRSGKIKAASRKKGTWESGHGQRRPAGGGGGIGLV